MSSLGAPGLMFNGSADCLVIVTLSLFQTDVCGIKWTVWRANDTSAAAAASADDPLEDPVLASFALCLDAGLLAVWRRVPRRCLVDYSFDNAGNQGRNS
jgi:hypothetical protein